MHRIGGLEKADITGNVSYDPDNHEHMIHLRAQKVANVADDLPPQEVVGPKSGDLLVVSWGGTYGSCVTAVQRCNAMGISVAHTHLRYLNPLPKDLGDILGRYEQVLAPELNSGQLSSILRAKYLKDVISLTKVKGKPFAVSEIVNRIRQLLA
jgi:2-oxoglutarate ferredoxin oxidoreductase subunit alpha